MLYVTYPQWLSPEIIPGFPVRWYGLMYLFAFATAYAFLISQVKKDPSLVPFAQRIPNLVFWTIIGILLCARLVSELVYSKNISILIKPWLLIWPFDSSFNFVGLRGMSYHGGLLGCILFSVGYGLLFRMPILKISDRIAIGASLGYGFGRLGNFANAELYGRITSSSFGMLFPNAERLPYGDIRVQTIADKLAIEPDAFGMVNLPRHPSQLYEAFLESIVTFAILFTIYKLILHTKYYMPGMFVPLYVICYSIARFIAEYFRQPDAGLDFVIAFSDTSNPRWLFVSPWNFTMGQVFSIALIVLSIIVLVIMKISYTSHTKRKIFMHS